MAFGWPIGSGDTRVRILLPLRLPSPTRPPVTSTQRMAISLAVQSLVSPDGAWHCIRFALRAMRAAFQVSPVQVQHSDLPLFFFFEWWNRAISHPQSLLRSSRSKGAHATTDRAAGNYHAGTSGGRHPLNSRAARGPRWCSLPGATPLALLTMQDLGCRWVPHQSASIRSTTR
jgi:hypothetical protein